MSKQYKGIVPYLFYDDAEAAIDWYGEIFGFEEIGRSTNDEGKIQNAEMRVGNTEIWIDGSGRLKKEDDRPIWVGVWVEDVDAIYENVREKGIECEEPITREFGVRMLNVDDGMGHLWGFIKRVPHAAT